MPLLSQMVPQQRLSIRGGKMTSYPALFSSSTISEARGFTLSLGARPMVWFRQLGK